MVKDDKASSIPGSEPEVAGNRGAGDCCGARDLGL